MLPVYRVQCFSGAGPRMLHLRHPLLRRCQILSSPGMKSQDLNLSLSWETLGDSYLMLSRPLPWLAKSSFVWIMIAYYMNSKVGDNDMGMSQPLRSVSLTSRRNP
ncbi:hypothetical protein ACJJTC_010411 [Scirpophaga incertulas]